MDPFSFEDGINYMLQSPLLFSNNFDGDDNASYHSINENIFQSPNINPNYNTDYNYNYEDETNFKTAPLLKNFLKDNKSDFFSLDIIKDFLNALIENKPLNDSNKKLINDSKEIIEKIISIKEEEKSMLLGKNININDDKKKDDEKEEKKEGGNNYLKKKRGRPTCEKGLGKNDKYKSDNIMKKNKILLINASLKFMNSFLDKDELKKIKHKFINNLNKKKNLELLEKPLKDIFSLDISTKYTSKQNNFNADLINTIFSKNNENIYDKTKKFLFNITLNDFIDLYTYKIDISSLAEKYNAINIDCGMIGEKFHGVEHLLKEISEKNNEYYYSLFLLHIFNYKRWFVKLKGRKHKIKKNKK
jgi:hypothetical protein